MAKKNTVIKIYNRSRQMIPLQVKPPGGDYFLHEQTIYLSPKKTVSIPSGYLLADQIKNLKARRELAIVSGTEDDL